MKFRKSTSTKWQNKWKKFYLWVGMERQARVQVAACFGRVSCSFGQRQEVGRVSGISGCGFAIERHSEISLWSRDVVIQTMQWSCCNSWHQPSCLTVIVLLYMLHHHTNLLIHSHLVACIATAYKCSTMLLRGADDFIGSLWLCHHCGAGHESYNAIVNAMHSGILLNYWGPVHSHKSGENVQCSIGLGSEGVFPEFHTESFFYNDTPL